MRSKILCLFVMVMLLPALSTVEASNPNDDVEIKISAGMYGRDIGNDLRIDVVNNKNESVTIYENIVKDYFIRDYLDKTLTNNNTLPANDKVSWMWAFKRGLFHISITIEGGNTKVKREGICICSLMILFK